MCKLVRRFKMYRFGSAMGLVLAAATMGCTLKILPPTALSNGFSEWQEKLRTPTGVAEWVKSSMQPSADPCTDFYEYACGRRRTPPFAGLGLLTALTQSRLQLWTILVEQLEKSPGGDAQAEMAGDLFASCLDISTRRQQLAGSMQELLQPVVQIDGLQSGMAAIGHLHRHGIRALFDLSVVPSVKDPTRYAIELRQGGLGLEQPQVYLSDSQLMREIRKRYRNMISRSLFDAKVYGLREGDETAGTPHAILALETVLARHCVAQYQLLPDPETSPQTIAQLEQTTGLPWHAYFEALGLGEQRELEIVPADYFRTLGTLLQQLPLATLRTHLAWLTTMQTVHLRSDVPVLHSKKWESCVASTEAAFGGWLWKVHAARYQGDEVRQQAATLWREIEDVLAKHVGKGGPDPAGDGLVRKVRGMRPLVAFPAQVDWTPMVSIAADDFIGNVLASRKAWFDRQAELVGQPLQGNNLTPSPAVAMPEYRPRLNQVVIPASILQAPLYSANFPAAMNYGGLGMVVGHEMAHALDRYGRRIGPGGEVLDQTPPAAQRMEHYEQCLAEHFGRFDAAPEFYSRVTASVLPAVPVDLDLTMNENFADVIGVRLAFLAYQQRTGVSDEPIVPGLTADQLFFVAYAQNWCGEPDEHTRRLLAESDLHTTPRARVNGTLSALPEFAEAFGCSLGSGMWPNEHCEMW